MGIMKNIISFLLNSRKIWIPFIVEFLFLFLAVYLGFLTENFRDQRVAREKEKQYLQGIIQDVISDQKLSRKVIADFEMRSASLDSAWIIFHKLVNGNLGAFNSALAASHAWEDFYPTTSAYEQLKNGGFHLVQNPLIVDSINHYHQKMGDLMGETENFTRHIYKLWDARDEFLDYYKIDSLRIYAPSTMISVRLREVMHTDYKKGLSTYYKQLRSVKGGFKSMAENHRIQITAGDHLINIIRKEIQKL